MILWTAYNIIRFLITKTVKENTIETTILSGKETINQFKTLRGYYTKKVVGKIQSVKGALFGH